MANIKQQKKRVGIAARQRLENLRYKSTARTLFRSLQDSVNLGDKDAASGFHRELVRLLDRAAARNVMHKNTVARKKARAGRILESEPVVQAQAVRRARKKPVRKAKAETAAAATTAASADRSKKKAAAADTGKRKPAAAAPDETLPETQAATADVEGEAATETEMSKAAVEGDAEVPAEAEAPAEEQAPEAEASAEETGEGSEKE